MAKVFVMKCAGLGILLPCVISKFGPGYFSCAFDIFSPGLLVLDLSGLDKYIDVFHFIQGVT